MTVAQILNCFILFWNLVVFVTYGIDKGKARRGAWRIPEKTLLLMALCGGGMGAILAGYFFHHKTRKVYFVATWCLGLLVDLALFWMIWR
ncbi:DUF1294 domain-containing protein [Streptococcus sp. DD13]|uniref:DUF1294 domain-containing protein n=1 Tax=Streptococcus sp. DD13 TaxID=1777881 RepID=UPI0007912B07|nr:DUF1294 domain-containing protein [Streptococcus sp. DD13]KXT78376.1 putative membrane protein [Streptococcus sp. DD13]